MKTLFIEFGYLSGNGGGIYASRSHINLFASLSKEMTLVYPWKEGKDIEGINLDKINVSIPVNDNRSKIQKFWDLCCGKVHRFKLDESFFDQNRFDLVVFDNSIVSSRLIKKFKKYGIKAITIHHNYQIEYLIADSPKITLLPSLFWTLLYEKAAVKYSDLNITLTPEDAELLKKHYCKNSIFGVLGVSEYQNNQLPILISEKKKNRFLITGHLQSKQTEDSLIPWIHEYWPILKKIVPDATLTIAGYKPSQKLSDFIINAGIKLIDSPSDMFPILELADYYICPTDCGGGLKLRILDGLKAGLPVLTHKVSARGYEKMIEIGLVISYDNYDSFKLGLKKLLSNNLKKEEVQKEYSLVYSFESGKKRLKNILTINKII